MMGSDDRDRRGHLRKEAERLQRLMEDAARARGDGSSEAKLLIFHLGEDTFAVPLDALEEVLAEPALTRVPAAPGHILGVAGVRGDVVPVVHLGRFLEGAGESSGGDEDPARGESFVESTGSAAGAMRVLLVGRRQGRVGLKVDAIGDVGAYTEEEIQTGAASDLVRGELVLRGRRVRLLDLEALLEALRRT